MSQLFSKQAHPQSTLPRPLWVRVMWTISRIQKCKSPSPKLVNCRYFHWNSSHIITKCRNLGQKEVVDSGIQHNNRRTWERQLFLFFQPAKRIHLSRCPLNHAGSNDMYEVIGADTTSLPTFGKWVFVQSPMSKGSFRFQKNICFGSTSQYILWSPRYRLIFFSDFFHGSGVDDRKTSTGAIAAANPTWHRCGGEEVPSRDRRCHENTWVFQK